MNGEKDFIGTEYMVRCVARTQDLMEANRVAEEYEAKGYQVNIVKKQKGGVTLYEVWAKGETKTFEIK